MKEQDKQLLLTDLCGRLPYGVKGRVFAETSKGDYDINGDMIFINTQFVVVLDQVNIQTEEIRVTAVGNENTVEFIDNEQDFGKPYHIEDFKPYLRPMSSMTKDEEETECYLRTYAKERYANWCYNRHLDIDDLIEKGLALEAPEGMYNIK